MEVTGYGVRILFYTELPDDGSVGNLRRPPTFLYPR
jgi:hypothetical protein